MKQLWVVLMMLFSTVAIAATENRTVSVEAVGKNREEAVFNALGEAVRQVRGAEISASRQVRSILNRLSVRTDDGRQASVEMESSYSGSTKVASEGLISGYRVVSVTDAQDGSGKLARLEVDVPVYVTSGSSGQDSRWRVAVYPVATAESHYSLAGKRYSAEEVSRRLTQAIVQSLVQSRRFAVLARDQEEAILEEKYRIAHGDVPVAEKAMLGNMLGAEYLVTARVVDLSLDTLEKVSSLTGERTTQETGAVVLESRILVPATGKIVWSQTLNSSAAQLEVQLSGGAGAAQVFDAAGRELALRALDVIWPPLVEKNSGGQLVINMGGDLIYPGQQWDVFMLGDQIRSSHSKESLGREEQWTAKVEIVRSTPKVSYARVIEGKVDGVGQVLRRAAMKTGMDRKTQERGTRKRVCLPMDPC